MQPSSNTGVTCCVPAATSGTGLNDEDESLQVSPSTFAHLTASNSPLAHKICPNWFQWVWGRGGHVWREKGKDNKGMDVQIWHTQCQVLFRPPSLMSSGRCSQTTAHNFQKHFPAFTNTGSKKKSTEHNFVSTKLGQTNSFGSTLNWQQVQLTRPTDASWQIPMHRLQFLWLLVHDMVLFFKLCKGHEGQFNQQRIFA